MQQENRFCSHQISGHLKTDVRFLCDHSDRGALKEVMNPSSEWTHRLLDPLMPACLKPK